MLLVRLRLLAFVLICWASPCLARAEVAARGVVQLLWDAPSVCPRAAEVLAAALPDARREEAVRVRVHGVVRTQAARFELVMRIQEAGPAGSRTLSAESCQSLVEASALIIALAADAQRVEPPARVGWRVAGVSSFDVGSLPGPSIGLGAALGVTWGRWSVNAEAMWWLPRQTRSDVVSQPGGEIGLVTGALRGCFTVWSGRYLGLSPCGGVELGRSHGTGTGLAPNRQRSGLWAATLLGVSLHTVGERRYFVDVGLDSLVPWHRQRYVADGLGTLFRAAPVCGRAAVRLGLSF